MNREYYGTPTTANEDFLMHYGVRGMKWGVRKARESGNARRLGKHYARAAKKLKLLSMQTDKDLVSKLKKQHAKGIASRAIGGGLVSGIGTAAISKGSLKDRALWGAGIGGGMAAINLAGDAVDQIRLKRMLSSKGYAKNVAKRNAFEKEMRNSFKGTPYAKKINATKRDINNEINLSKKAMSALTPKKNKPVAKQKKRSSNGTLKTAAKAAALSTIMGPGAAMYVQSKKTANEDWGSKSKKRRR